MRDLAGKELRLGDKVAVTSSGGYMNLELTHVIGFTPKKVKVAYYGSYGLRESNQIVILERDPVMEAKLASPDPATTKEI